MIRLPGSTLQCRFLHSLGRTGECSDVLDDVYSCTGCRKLLISLVKYGSLDNICLPSEELATGSLRLPSAQKQASSCAAA